MPDPIALQNHDLYAPEERAEQHEARSSRRRFLQLVGAGGGAAALALAGCDTAGPTVTGSKIDGSGPGSTQDEPPADVVFDFSTEFGVLNFAYMLEQLEATFYVMACNNFYGASAVEGNHLVAQPSLATLRSRVITGGHVTTEAVEEYFLASLRSRENAHAVWFKTLLGENAIPSLEFDFSSIDFSDRTSVLNAAMTFENVGTSAYNGAAQYLASPFSVALAGKIVSVEARHAALLRQILFDSPQAFANLDSQFLLDLGAVPDKGLGVAQPAVQVLDYVNSYVVQDLAVIGT